MIIYILFLLHPLWAKFQNTYNFTYDLIICKKFFQYTTMYLCQQNLKGNFHDYAFFQML